MVPLKVGLEVITIKMDLMLLPAYFGNIIKGLNLSEKVPEVLRNVPKC
jgi:hypothetical protein